YKVITFNWIVKTFFNSTQYLSKISANGPGIAEGGASLHLTPTEIPYFKSKQNFLKKQLTPACGNTLLAVRLFTIYFLLI
ncbi:hypothetical protein, partial [Riemerella anatipestifer]|uniref:hypothetical protein n=1 Tax=Riemerella anatipestifer TaxID=34085 RepID=UPI0028675E92